MNIQNKKLRLIIDFLSIPYLTYVILRYNVSKNQFNEFLNSENNWRKDYFPCKYAKWLIRTKNKTI